MPLAVKDLRPLRGAFGVLDREPPARHRQMEGQAKGPASACAAQPYIAEGQFRLCSAGDMARVRITANRRSTYPQVGDTFGGSRQAAEPSQSVPGLQASSPVTLRAPRIWVPPTTPTHPGTQWVALPYVTCLQWNRRLVLPVL